MESVPTFRILGALEVEGVEALGGPRQRAVLAALLLEPGKTVSADALLATVWGPEAPPTAVRTLRSYISRLRALLGGEVLQTRGWGYVLDTTDVDSVRFQDLVAEARATGNMALFRAADALWRGRPLADLPELATHPEVARLEEVRLSALEDRFAAEPDVVELERLVAAHPFRERLWELLIEALYRSGRQADALAAFARARALLDEELGLEPGVALQELQRRVLRHELPAAAPPTNLFASIGPIVGRESELEELDDLLGASRLVTVTGIGGGGKTRVALEAARRAVGRYAGGTWLVELAPVPDGDRVADAVAGAVVGAVVGAEGTATAVEAASRRLEHALLVVDNAEHLLPAAAAVVERLLGAVPTLRVLVTSRRPLGLSGETVYVLPPLDSHAVELFERRAREARPAFELSRQEHVEAAQICRLLDGIPLAIELAAARVRLLGVAEIREHIASGGVLGWPGGSRPQRHRSLRATIDWSYRLLDEQARRALPRLAVFAGSFTAAAASSVSDVSLDALLELVECSLVVARPDLPTRYRLLDTIRAYARELGGPADHLARAHAYHYLAVAEHAAAAAFGPREDELLAVVEAEHDEVRAALAWALAGGDVELGVRLARALTWFWVTRGHAFEARSWLERALPFATGETRSALLGACGVVEFRLGAYANARRFLAEAAATTNDRLAAGRWLHYLAGAYRNAGDDARAREVAAQSLEAERATGDVAGEAWTTGFLADTAQMAGDVQTAARLYEDGLELVRAAGFPPRLVVGYTSSRAELALRCGELAQAEKLARAVLVDADRLGERWHVALAHAILAEAARRRGSIGEAWNDAREALRHAWETCEMRVVADVVELTGVIATSGGDPAQAALLFGAADGLRRRSGVRGGLLATDAEAARSQLNGAFERELSAGVELNDADAVALALGDTPAP